MPEEAADLGLLEDEGGTGTPDEGGEPDEIEEEPSETPGETPDEEETEEPAPEEEPAGRATRTLPGELRKALREFSAGNPEFAKKFPRLERQLSAALFKAADIDRRGGLQNLRVAAEVVEQHGGPQGIREMAEEVEASRVMEEGLKVGDPVLVATIAEQYPEGFKNMVGNMVAKLETMDLPAHDRAISPAMVKALDRCGVFQTAYELKAAIAGERWEDIQKHASALENFLGELRQFAARTKAPDPLQSQREDLERERGEVQSERTKTFYGGVRTQVNTEVMAYTNRLLRQALAGRSLRVETANRVRKQINEDLAAAVNTAPGYADKYKATMNAGDHQRAVQFVVGAAKQKLPLVVKRVLRDFNLAGKPGGTPARRTAGGGGERSSTVAGRPKTGDVDFTRTDKATWLGSLNRHGQAWLKNGKQARW